MNYNLNEDFVSVIMPAYNCEKYVTDSIKSVLNQTYKNIELIIVEDCSKDDTLKFIKNAINNDNRVKLYVNSKNQGVSYTRNKGISNASGDWIAFLDSDDLWVEDKLEKQISYAYNNSADFLFTGSSFINEYDEPYRGVLNVPLKVSYIDLLKQNVISCSSVFIKRGYLKDIKMERDDIHEDYGTWLRILKILPYAYGINEPLLIYRIYRNSKSGNKLKSLVMQYKTYRYNGLSIIKSFYYLGWYIIRGLKKYKKIFT